MREIIVPGLSRLLICNCFSDILRCDVGIVGGGISGLYMAYEILKDNSNTKVCIFEKEDTVGGRIRDHRFKEAPNIDVGLGAWSVDKKQYIMLDLLKELGISTKEWSFEEPSLYKSREIEADNSNDIKKGYPALQNDPKFGNMSSGELWNYLLKPEIASQSDKFATAFTYMSNMITSEGAYYLADLSAYKSGITEFVNPTQYIECMELFYTLSDKYVRPHGGMSAIIGKLNDEVKRMGAHIYTSTEVQSISKKHPFYILRTPNIKVIAERLVVATPPKPFRSVRGKISRKIQGTPQFDSIQPIPAFKGGAVYKNPWWEGLMIGHTAVKAGQKYISQDNCLGITMAHRGYGTNGEGVMHTVYSDGACARRWNEIAELKKDYIDDEIHRALEAKYGVKIPDPVDTEYQYWESAWHYQKPDTPFTLVDIRNWARKPFPDENIFVVGDSYDPMRGWCQGAIVSCRHALKDGWGIERVQVKNSAFAREQT